MSQKLVPEVDATCKYPDACRSHTPINGTYQMRGSCGNCGSQVTGTFTRGHRATRFPPHGPECPVCGVRELHWHGLA